MAYRLLLAVDDKPSRHMLLGALSKKKDFEVVGAETGQSALNQLGGQPFEGLFCDLKLSDLSGHDLIRAAKTINPECLVVLISGYGDRERAIQSIHLGVFSILFRPFRPMEVDLVLDNIAEKLFLTEQIHDLTEKLTKLQKLYRTRKAEWEQAAEELEELKAKLEKKKEVQSSSDIRDAIAQAAKKKTNVLQRYDVYQELQRLNRLHEERLISPDEFKDFRTAVLEKVYKIEKNSSPPS